MTLEGMERESMAHGYTHLRTLDDGRVIGLMEFAFTTGLVVGITHEGHYQHRYCYELHAEALEALLGWDGSGDPPGPWVKNKGLGVDRSNPKLTMFKGVRVATEAMEA